jgi:hypothetical protein
MKKIFAIAILGTLTLASCSKDHVCECVTTNSADSSVNLVENDPITGKKSEAKATCEAMSASFGTVSKTCNLK